VDWGAFYPQAAGIRIKKTFQFITMGKGDMNHYKPKKAKII